MPLRAVADVSLEREEPTWIAHLDGVRGLVLLISREVEASPLALDRSLRQTFDAFGVAERTRALIEELTDWASQDRFVYRHQWRPDDVLMWDNRSTMHLVTPFDAATERRVMHRTTLLGTAPVA